MAHGVPPSPLLIGLPLRSSTSRRDVRRLLLPALAVLAAAVVTVLVFSGADDPVLVDAGEAAATTDATDTDDTDTAAAPAADPAAADGPSAARMAPLQLPAGSGMTVGDPDAPVVMVAFESFGCLWCGHMHTRTMPAVMEDYVATGQLRIEARMLPYEVAATPGARIGAAAGLQDRYWDLAEHLYPFIAGTGEPPAGRELTAQELGAYRDRQTEDALLEEVVRVADDIDLDWERFYADYDSEQVREIVARDTQLARQLGFSGTPAMIINGVPVGGYRSEATFRELLDAVLEASTTAG